VLAVLAELSQLGRELRFLGDGATPPQVWLLDPEAEDLAADHRIRQQRHAFDPLSVSAVAGHGALPDLEAALDRVAAANGTAVVVVARTGTRLGTRLAVRHPELPVFELSAGTRPPASDEPVVGRLASFTVGLADASGRSADAWERAARAVHERYRRRFPDATLAVAWEDLPSEFYRESNRRQLGAILDGMVALGRTWAPTTAEDTGADEARMESPAEEVRIAEGRRLFDLNDEELTRLAAAEHESWRAHHVADGWRHGDIRDDRAHRHPDLLPWDQLGPAAREKTRAGVVDTLYQLRALGYRTVRADGAPAWGGYRRIGRVRARRLTASLSWRSAGGDPLTGTAGDWLVEDDSGGGRTVTDASFRATHRLVDGDTWERTGTVRARPAVPGEVVATQEGAVTAGTSAWVVRDDTGYQWVVGDEHFRAGYVSGSRATP
jgi:hypothetical protein